MDYSNTLFLEQENQQYEHFHYLVYIVSLQDKVTNAKQELYGWGEYQMPKISNPWSFFSIAELCHLATLIQRVEASIKAVTNPI